MKCPRGGSWTAVHLVDFFFLKLAVIDIRPAESKPSVQQACIRHWEKPVYLGVCCYLRQGLTAQPHLAWKLLCCCMDQVGLKTLPSECWIKGAPHSARREMLVCPRGWRRREGFTWGAAEGWIPAFLYGWRYNLIPSVRRGLLGTWSGFFVLFLGTSLLFNLYSSTRTMAAWLSCSFNMLC